MLVAALSPAEDSEEDPVEGRIGPEERASMEGPLGDLDEFTRDDVA